MEQLNWFRWQVVLLAGCLALGGCCGGGPKITTRPELNKGDDEPPPPPPTETAAPTAASPAASEPTPTKEPPPRPPNVEELREQSAAKMRELALAVHEYVNAQGVLPSYGEKLSWRVALLPYLGYDELYRKFHHDEVWNSEHNETLIGDMPDIFRVPGDERALSGYELFGGRDTICPTSHGMAPKQVADGLRSTLLMIQIDKAQRREPWTKPTAVGSLDVQGKAGGSGEADPLVLVMWADGRVAALDRAALALPDFRAAMTPAGGESFNLAGQMRVMGGSLIHAAARPSTATEISPAAEEAPAAATSASDPPSSTANTGQRREGRGSEDARLAVPQAKDQRRALEVVRQLFLKRYQDAGNQRDRQKIAAEMFEKSQRMGDDVAGEFVMVTTAIKIALESNDVETAGQAVQHLVDRFQFDTYDMKVALLRKTDKLTTTTPFDTRILEDGIAMLREAVERDDYDVAKEMADVALAAARRTNHKETASDLVRVKQELDRVASAYSALQKAIETVGDPSNDAAVSEQAGKFYCFFKGDWERGLPYLARSTDPQLRGLSQRDLEAPVDHEKQIRLADGWFELAQQMRSPEDQHARRRSLYWYEAAIGSLPDGLARLKAEVRINELKEQLTQ